MRLRQLKFDHITVSPELERSKTSKQFEDRLRASIDAIGIVEPLKVAPLATNNYVVIDGVLRLRAISSLRARDPKRFSIVPAYVFDYTARYEIRFQTDIYQDLLPSQLACLVEHLHQQEHVSKGDIAEYIGVSAPTLRNYTGLWRLLQRGALFAAIVDLMDVGVIPSSNPFAWLRLTAPGLRFVIERRLADGQCAEAWIEQQVAIARQGNHRPLRLKFVESVTGDLPSECYRVGEQERALKRSLGLRRTPNQAIRSDFSEAMVNLQHVAIASPNPVLRAAAIALQSYLR